MKEITKFIFNWFWWFLVITLILFSAACYALFCSDDSPNTIQNNRFAIELKGRVIDIRVNNETHQYIQYRTSGFKNSFQLTHWEGCKYCQEKERTLNKK